MNIVSRIRSTHVVYALIICLAVLSILALTFADSAFAFVFFEGGVIEQLSIVFWLVLAGFLMLAVRPLWSFGLPAAVLSLLCAAREADWHKRFTDYSVLKPGYFLNPQFALWGKVLVAGILAAALASVIALLAAWKRRQGRLDPAGRRGMQIVLIGLVVLVLSKVTDRLPALIRESTGEPLPAAILRVLMAWEEGLECAVPLVLASAVAVGMISSRSSQLHERERTTRGRY